MSCKLPSSRGWARWRAQQIHLGVLSPWPSGVEQWKEHRTSRRWRHEGRDALMATEVHLLTGYTVKVSRSSASYFWYFPNNVVLTITFALNFLPIVCVRVSKLHCCSTSAVIFPLNCGSTPKNVCKNGLVGNHCSVYKWGLYWICSHYKPVRVFTLYQNSKLGPMWERFFPSCSMIPRDIAATG